MKKKGQFFLIAALIISVLAISLATIYVSTSSQEDETPNDLLQQVQYESAKVIDHFVLRSSEGNLSANLSEFIKLYAQSYPDNEIIFVYGDRNSPQSYYYKKTSVSGVNLNTGGSDRGVPNVNITSEILPSSLTENNITVRVDNFSYTFNLTDGYNFFLVIKREVQNETFIAASQ